MKLDPWSFLLFFMVSLYACMMPYTKVEESFNLQAIHDVLYHGTDIEAYDHNQFPGVVPRTFFNAFVVSFLSYPVLRIGYIFGFQKIHALCVVRLTIGFLSVLALHRFRMAASRKFGRKVGIVMVMITCLQFHIPFYFSRPLPNVFAMMLTNVALGLWIEGHHPIGVVYLLAFAACVLRCDVILLAGPIGLQMCATKEIRFFSAVKHGLVAVAASVALTIAFDSILWGRLLYPEGIVLFFNTVQNRSSDWGRSPWHWYLSSALPRSLLGALPLAMLGPIADQRLRKILLPCICFVALYSMLPHKELRFIFYILPLFNLSAACTIVHARRLRYIMPWKLMHLTILFALLGTAFCTFVFAKAASLNYPGGVALRKLHDLDRATTEQVRVHVDTYAAMTGVSRFGEERADWMYDKTEGLDVYHLNQLGFTYVVSEDRNIPGFQLILEVSGFDGIRLQRGVPPLEFRIKPKVFVHERIS